jgi:hypothetical protein
MAPYFKGERFLNLTKCMFSVHVSGQQPIFSPLDPSTQQRKSENEGRILSHIRRDAKSDLGSKPSHLMHQDSGGRALSMLFNTVRFVRLPAPSDRVDEVTTPR